MTTNYDALAFAGHHSQAQLLGVFNVSVLHNIVHLIFGVLGIALSGTFTAARGFLIGSGLVYAALWLYGLVIDHDSGANFVPVNTADNWLHLGLAVGMLALVPAAGPHRGRTGSAARLGNLLCVRAQGVSDPRGRGTLTLERRFE